MNVFNVRFKSCKALRLTSVFIRARPATPAGQTESVTEINETVEESADVGDKVDSPSPSPNPENQTEEQEDNPAPRHEEPEDSYEPPQQAVRVGREEEAENLHMSPLNLHQSPTHRPPAYQPAVESSQGPPGYSSVASPYPAYNQHYFNNANNNYNGQTVASFMPPGWTAEQHEMYIGRGVGPPPPHDSLHSSHHLTHPAGLSHLGLNQFGRMGGHPHSHGQDPYNFPNSDEELCSPGRTSGPLTMGFSGMPMPLIAPKAQKPRKPRKPRSPKQEEILSMQMKEDSRRYRT